jgi:uncharacterized protein YabE (DUF348 family)
MIPSNPATLARPASPTVTRQQVGTRAQRLAFLSDSSTYLLLLLLVSMGALSLHFVSSLRAVTINIDSQPTTLWTRQTTVRGALTEAGISLNDHDVTFPASDQAIPADGHIAIHLAQTISLQVDGDTFERRTQSATVAAFLDENQVKVKVGDHILVDGRLVELNTPLPRFASAPSRSAIPSNQSPITHMAIQRAVPININDNGAVSTIYTTEPTLGQAIRQAGVMVYLGDYVTPGLGEPATSGRTVFINRSKPATISVDGRTIHTRTRAETVAGLLGQEGIKIEGKDFSSIALSEPMRADLRVSVTRVREIFDENAEPIKFETLYQPDPDVEIDNEVVTQTGQDGVKKILIKSVLFNGVLTNRAVEREWIDKAKQDKIIHYGTKIVERQLTLPDDSVVTYWRKIRMLATSYSAATSGKSTSHPQYGITFTGIRAGKGIVAVDPKIVNLRSTVYVPGYGMGLAGDTGGAIIGRHIDLGYDEWSLVSWYAYVDVYLLSPVPQRAWINFRLPALPYSRYLSGR